MGGAQFNAHPENRTLHQYILSISRADRPRICLLPTVSGDEADQVARFHQTFAASRCKASHLSLMRLGVEPESVRERLLEQDIIYVGGGSMLNLLAIWDTHGVDDILREAWEAGTVLCGLSAGSMCWFEWGVTKSFGPPRATQGLGFLPGSNCVHYHDEPDRRPYYLQAIRDGLPAGWGVDDRVGLLFAGTRLVKAVAGGPQGRAYRVAAEDGSAVEQALDVTRLHGLDSAPDAAADVEEYRRLLRARTPGRPGPLRGSASRTRPRGPRG